MSAEDVHRDLPAEASSGGVALLYLVSVVPGEERKAAESIAAALLGRFASPYLVTLFLPGLVLRPGPTIDTIRSADRSATSFSEALQVCLDWLQERSKSR
jgi:hypothetical protein